MRLSLESENGKLFIVQLDQPNRVESVHWVSLDTRSSKDGSALGLDDQYRLSPVGFGYFAIFVPEKLLGSNRDYQFAFAVKRRGKRQLDYDTGDYLRIRNGSTRNALRDFEREDLFADRQAVARRLYALRMTPKANHLLQNQWFKEMRHRYAFPSDDFPLGLSASEAIQAFGHAGMRLVQRALMFFVPQHAERVRHWDEEAYLRVSKTTANSHDVETRTRWIVDYLRERIMSGMVDTLTPNSRRELYFQITDRLSPASDHLISDWKRLWMVSAELAGRRWFYIIDRARTSLELMANSPRVSVYEILERMRKNYFNKGWIIHDVLKESNQKYAANSSISVGRSGIAVIEVKPHRGRTLQTAG